MKDKSKKILEIATYQFETFDNAIEIAFENLSERLYKINDKNKTPSEFSKSISNLKKSVNIDRFLDEFMELFREALSNVGEIANIHQELKSLCEMRIIYLYKNIELSIKRIIEIAYPEIKTNSFFNVNRMNEFFQSKGIKLKKIKNYDIFDQLRKVSNNLKHNKNINENLKISEFENISEFDFTSLSEFYIRIYANVHNFLENIGNEIIDDLYEFNDERLTNISNSLKERMSSDKLELFIEKLKKSAN